MFPTIHVKRTRIERRKRIERESGADGEGEGEKEEEEEEGKKEKVVVAVEAEEHASRGWKGQRATEPKRETDVRGPSRITSLESRGFP